MTPRNVMLIAGEPSGDLLAAELVQALREQLPAPVRFFAAGGPRLAEAGVELLLDLTQHAVVGLVEVIRRYGQFKRIFDQLLEQAVARRPDLIVCVDFSGFNRRFGHALRWEIQVRGLEGWRPRIVQYVSPQVWASRPGRARAMARDFDLLLAIFPFEKEWYAQRVPGFPVEFVGHPIVDRHGGPEAGLRGASASAPVPASRAGLAGAPPVPSRLLLLPGSRRGELRRHLPVLLEAFREIQRVVPGVQGLMVLPSRALLELAQAQSHPSPPGLTLQEGGLAGAMQQATVALASTGTVTMECAWFRLPTVALYKTSWSTYQIGRRIIQVKYLAMPNLLAEEPLFPEFIQDEATGPKIAAAALELLRDPARREQVQARLGQVVATLGEGGAARRAARAILAMPPRP